MKAKVIVYGLGCEFELKPYGNYFSWLGQEIGRLLYVVERYCNKLLTNDEQIVVYKMLYILNNYNSIDNCCAMGIKWLR